MRQNGTKLCGNALWIQRSISTKFQPFSIHLPRSTNSEVSTLLAPIYRGPPCRPKTYLHILGYSPKKRQHLLWNTLNRFQISHFQDRIDYGICITMKAILTGNDLIGTILTVFEWLVLVLHSHQYRFIISKPYTVWWFHQLLYLIISPK